MPIQPDQSSHGWFGWVVTKRTTKQHTFLTYRIKGQIMTQSQHHNTLDEARELITSIQGKLNQIYAVAPTLNGNNTINESLIHCATDFQQAAEKLAHPALRIATIGTTSAGKSTLVNGLIGRQIAPMDAGEMSAGVLHLVHSNKRHLKIDAVKGLWDGIDAAYKEDSAIYEHVRENIFKVYHEAKKTKTIQIPEIRIEGELLPAAWTELLALPSGVNVEIYDLPGLNNINDKENIKVIQNYLKHCFSLVVMNYLHTDSASRKELFKEVKKIVDALGGKTDAMIFVLNAVDARSETDNPLEDRIKEFANAIQQELKLKAIPNIIPVTARALFYAQCAWGWSNPISGESEMDKYFQTIQLKGFRKDCASFIEENETDEIESWLQTVKKALKENDKCLPAELLSEENLKVWIEWTWQHSGGLNLWGELRKRVDERFAEIVIAPTLIQPLASLETLLSKLDDYSRTQRITDKVDVEKKKAELQQKFEELQFFLEQESLKFEEQIRLTVEKMTDDTIRTDPEKRDIVIKELFGATADDTRLIAAEEALRNIVRDIKNDLIFNMIEPVHDFYTNENTSKTLTEELNKILTPELSDSIVAAAERYGKRAMFGKAVKEGIDKKALKSNESDINEIKSIENAAHILFREMRAGLSERASYLLQTRDYVMEESLKVLLERGIVATEKRIRAELPEAAETLLLIYRQRVANVDLGSLPDDVFALGKVEVEDAVEEKTTTIDKKVIENEYYEEGSCFKSKHTIQVERIKKVDVVENVEVVRLSLPNVEGMTLIWQDGIEKAETALWRAVGEWFSQSAKTQNRLFQEALKDAQAHLLDLFVQRLEQSEAEYQIKLAELEYLDRFCSSIVLDNAALKNAANMKGDIK